MCAAPVNIPRAEQLCEALVAFAGKAAAQAADARTGGELNTTTALHYAMAAIHNMSAVIAIRQDLLAAGTLNTLIDVSRNFPAHPELQVSARGQRLPALALTHAAEHVVSH